MSEYVPTTEEIRDAYAVDEFGIHVQRYADEFDRWLAEHDRAVRADAFDQGVERAASSNLDVLLCKEANPYRKESR